MSGSVSQLSTLRGAPAGAASGGTVAGAAGDAFALLFALDATSGAAEDQVANTDADLGVRDRLAQLLNGLGRKAARLEEEGAEGAEGLEAVAEMASDLAAALAVFDRAGGSGLLPALAGLLPQEAGVSGAVERADAVIAAPTDAAEALGMFRAALGVVGTEMQALFSGSAPGQGATSSALFSALSVGEDRSAVALVAGEAADGRAVEIEAGAQAVAELSAQQEAQPEVATAAALTEMPADVAEGELLLIPMPAVRGMPAAAAGADLLSRIVAVATSLAAGPQPGEKLAEDTSARDRRLSVADVIAALPREAEAARPAAPERPDQVRRPDQSRFAEVLADQIRSAEVSEGRTRIELSPRGLGNIEVDVTDAPDGMLKVVVRADNPAVLNALRDGRDLLAQALGGLGGGALDLQSFSQQGAETGGAGRDGGIAALAEPEAEAAATAGEVSAQPELIGGGRLDIVT